MTVNPPRDALRMTLKAHNDNFPTTSRAGTCPIRKERDMELIDVAGVLPLCS
jgi:hypothetical protein